MKSVLITYLMALIVLSSTALQPLTAQAQDTTTEATNPIFLPLVVNQPAALVTAAAVTADLTDMLVLYDSSHPHEFDPYLCRLANFYGLQCRANALNSTPLTAAQLQDEQGAYFKLIAISANALNATLLTLQEVDLLKQAVTTGGAQLLIAKADSRQNLTLLRELTQGAITGVRSVQDKSCDWAVSSQAPAITSAFAGLTIKPTKSTTQGDYAIVTSSAAVKPLLTSMDSTRQSYPLFVQYPLGRGAIFVDAGKSPGQFGKLSLTDLYFNTQYFSTVIPTMMVIQGAFGPEAWHSQQAYVNFTIDDPALQTVNHLLSQWKPMDYLNLLPQMQAHHFHLTIAWQPRNWQKSDPEIVNLFVNNPSYFSIAQHGNNHDGFEFYKYTATSQDRRPARPLAEQVADIREGLTRIEDHYQRTRIPYDRLMLFPYGNGPVGTLAVLKQYDYLATVQGPATPLMAAPSARWDYDMYPANLDFANFPLVRRQILDNPNDYTTTSFAQNLFLHKPILLSSHANPMFGSSIRAFNPLADEINRLAPEIQWQNLGYVLKHMYLEKQRDDGATEVMMQGNNIVLENDHNRADTFYIVKEETLNVPIRRVTVNGQAVNYTVAANQLRLTLALAANAAANIFVDYEETTARAATLEPTMAEAWIETWDEQDAQEDIELEQSSPNHLLYLPLITR